MVRDKILRDDVLEFFKENVPVMGNITLKYFGKVSEFDAQNKEGHIHDPVTKADLEISQKIIQNVQNEFGNNVALLTEESAKDFGYTLKQLYSSRKPIIINDELDGTVNFTRGIPFISHLFAFAEFTGSSYEVTAALTYNPLTQEFYFATIDTDAIYQKDGLEKKIKVSDSVEMITGMNSVNVAIGRETFPKDYPGEYYKVTDVMESFEKGNKKQIEKNSKFSCGLEVIDVAKGDVDVYMIAKAANWDYAGSSLILQQAGGKSYLAKNVDMLINPVPWKLQLEKPGEYYPAIFTNGKIDFSFFKEM